MNLKQNFYLKPSREDNISEMGSGFPSGVVAVVTSFYYSPLKMGAAFSFEM
jgi:hypothetical protein